MNIKKISEITGLSPHTLRYYEKIGLLKNIGRNSAGYREYTEKDVAWIEFLGRLKETGMPLKVMFEFSQLRYRGETTVNERLKILENHKFDLQERIEKLSENLEKINEKIKIYRNFK